MLIPILRFNTPFLCLARLLYIFFNDMDSLSLIWIPI
jgi:hypothetical protein